MLELLEHLQLHFSHEILDPSSNHSHLSLILFGLSTQSLYEIEKETKAPFDIKALEKLHHDYVITILGGPVALVSKHIIP